ncbi:ZP3 protein, partial [Polyodon spathula]|nr:ZP3 protein [Polyodon spathula]
MCSRHHSAPTEICADSAEPSAALKCYYWRLAVAVNQRDYAKIANNWSGPRVSNVICLGDVLHIEASVTVDNHVPLLLCVDSCIATLSDNKDSKPRYAVVDKLGCLMDSKSPDSSSSFTRPALNKMHFDITAFKIQGDSRSMIYMTCTLSAVNADKPADVSNKACSYQKQTSSCPSDPDLPPAVPLSQACQDPRVHVKEITHGPLTVVHVARDHAVVLSKDSLYHPLPLVEEVQLSMLLSAEPACWQWRVALCRIATPEFSIGVASLLCVPVNPSGSSVPVLAVSTVALALSCAVLLAVFLKRRSQSSDKLLAVCS